ncbi:hypothetical protein C5614_16340 [Massilia phosphatilytica]|nr:hypothetical protein C5614_16340 [Massilia phosphatilytica]
MLREFPDRFHLRPGIDGGLAGMRGRPEYRCGHEQEGNEAVRERHDDAPAVSQYVCWGIMDPTLTFLNETIYAMRMHNIAKMFAYNIHVT